MTIHSLLDLNPDMESKLDFTKGNPKTAVLMSLDVLFIDEARPALVSINIRLCRRIVSCMPLGVHDRRRLLERNCTTILRD